MADQNTNSSNSSPGNNSATGAPAVPHAVSQPSAGAPAAGSATVDQLEAARFEIAAARAGVPEKYSVAAYALWAADPAKPEPKAFVAGLRQTHPEMFGGAAPPATMPSAGAPSVPPPGRVSGVSARDHFNSLVAGGKRADAEAYWHLHQLAITAS